MSSEKVARSGSHSALRDFLENEAAGGILLMVAAALAMIVANSPLYDMYHHFLHELEGPTLSKKLGPMTPHLWINDGLMAIFFMLVGLEIKREFVDGRLNTWERRRLPVLAAAAGMAVPALFFMVIVKDSPELYNGWAIPAATDIAFAIGVLALLGPRAPASLKLFLVTVAIVDDMGAVAIIALVYTAEINGAALLASAVILGAMYTMNKAGVLKLWPYLIGAVLLWYAVLMSGVHATIAGVLAAMTIPIVRTPTSPDAEESPLHRLEHAIAPWSAFLIVPVFGFANAGVSLEGIGFNEIFAPLPLGIAAGLFFGKQLGIFASVWIAVKIGFAGRLGGASWLQVYGVSMLCGIGFTMSLFIGALAFPGNELLIEEAKIGVLGGSFLSAIVGYCILRFAPQEKELEAPENPETDQLKATT
ncbi:sodium/proton antiporter, NhaA family [Parasphingorhabdus marina DSM 22363]|uniref:Na(+)/H(+) antiporter NhaA n=1 Tax=Parasphingorhabdus marina DSM 22363 TaxID=1123272 RepID=A0A1N6CZB1_9SPHN|nr:Na+/H+ antiporter NhaA [Parasphingorhabdus marina]SIN63819.1 sodium/proton antiporter, NhaA family [Parasphingorhabdus marina DSM 22363]